MRKFTGIAIFLGAFTFLAASARADDGIIERWFRAGGQPASKELTTLRSRGPAGLKRLFDDYTAFHARLDEPAEKRKLERWFDGWIDQVCSQKLCRASQLYWYTDFSQALAEGRRTGKPILRLRLLGRLDEELSCANSRFYRTLVYPTPAVSTILRDFYILVWDSERPVPKVTIDLGEGRTLQTTVTGNSVHYVFDAQGRVTDAIPGLYDPATFAEILKRDLTFTHDSANLSESEFLPALYRFHSDRLKQLDEDWDRILKTPGGKLSPPSRRTVEKEETRRGEPDAATASQRAITKNVAQVAILNTVRASSEDPLDSLNRKDLWRTLADRYPQSDPLVRENRELIEKDIYDDLLLKPNYAKMYERIKKSLAFDTVRNEFLLHAAIHRWLSSSNTPIDFQPFNERIYRELFLTPPDDPWMGLLPRDSFNGLHNAGAHF